MRISTLPLIAALACTACDQSTSNTTAPPSSPAAAATVTTSREAALTSAEELVGKEAPRFTLPRHGGGEVDLKGLRGKKVLVNFWATWCAPCREEMPLLSAAAREHPGAAVVGVGYAQAEEAVQTFLTGHPVTFPIALDADGTVGDRYGAFNGLPLSVLVDEKGGVAAVHAGVLTPALIGQWLGGA